MHIYVYADTHNVYPEIFVIIFLVGRGYPRTFIYTQKFYREIILHFTLTGSHHYMYAYACLIDQLLYKYATVAVIEHIHRRGSCVSGYHFYYEIWEAAVGEVLQVRISDGAEGRFTYTIGVPSQKK